MISYKMDVLERQSLSEVKMGRGSPICERVHKRWWNTLKTTFLNIKLQRLCKSHHLQCIKSSKDSEKLEKSLWVRDKAEDLCWMPVVFGPSDDTASLIDMILSLTLLNGPRNTSRNNCRYTQSAVSPQPPPVCSIHLDDATAATGQWRQCAHHTPATGGEARES